MSMQFQGFKPQALERIAGTMGFSGDMENFAGYLEETPEAKQRMDMYNKKAIQMMNGGMVRNNYAEGGTVNTIPQLKKDSIDRMKTPTIPTGAVVTAVGTDPSVEQDIAATAGQVSTVAPVATPTTGTVGTAVVPEITTANTITATQNDPRVDATLAKTAAVQGTVDDRSVIAAQQLNESSVSDLATTEGTSVNVADTANRVMEIGERIDPVANAESAATFTEQVQAATATPTAKATVKGQLDSLMMDFEGGNTPAWAAGGMRAATAAMAARGLGASSMAGQAIVQAAMESSLPIAMADAQTQASFETQNLSNRQQRAILAAQQRATFMGQEFDQGFQSRVANAAKVSDIANVNFTAGQQVALENSRAANTMSITNMSNKQALLMGEVAAISNLDMANLSNRQTAAVKNAQTFLDTDMANLTNKQQTEMFKAQQRVQSLFTDTAADNAAKQFNASSQNQTDQFFTNLETQTSQFNASQTSAMSQFNSGEANALQKFNAEINNQRDQFNASNGLVIAQSNANWRREIATASTAAINRTNEVNAINVLGVSNQAYANLWQEHRDLMEFAWEGSDNERDRQANITLSHLAAGQERSAAEYQADVASSSSIGDFASKLALGYITKNFF